MFTPITESLSRLTEAVKEHGPETLALVRRYVEAKEQEAAALAAIASELNGGHIASFVRHSLMERKPQ